MIGVDGKQAGIMSLSEALTESTKLDLDLVEIAPKVNPPVVKIVNLGKFLYQEEKKLRREKKKTKAGEVKEVRLSPFIAEHDFNNRFKRIKEFLNENNKVRVVVKFKGKEMGSKKFGYDLLNKVTGSLREGIAIDMEPKFIGRHLMMVISPMKKVKRQEDSNQKSETVNPKS